MNVKKIVDGKSVERRMGVLGASYLNSSNFESSMACDACTSAGML